MRDNHPTRPEVDLEFDLMWATIWDSIWTEIFLREDASEAGWHLATSKILEVLDDPCEEGDDLFDQIRSVVANAQRDAWALMKTDASNEAVERINDAIGQAVDEVFGIYFPDHKPMRPWFPTDDVALFDTEDPTPRPMDEAVLVKLGFVGDEGTEFLLVEVLDPLDDGAAGSEHWLACLSHFRWNRATL